MTRQSLTAAARHSRREQGRAPNDLAHRGEQGLLAGAIEIARNEREAFDHADGGCHGMPPGRQSLVNLAGDGGEGGVPAVRIRKPMTCGQNRGPYMNHVMTAVPTRREIQGVERGAVRGHDVLR